MPKTILGYEPAAIGAMLQGIVPLLVFLHWWHLSGAQLGLISTGVAALTAAYVAFSTQHQTLAVVLGVIQAGIALAAGFGAGLSNEQSAAIIGAAGVIFGFFNRQVTVPKAKIRAAAALYSQTAMGAPVAYSGTTTGTARATYSGTVTGSPQSASVPVAAAVTRPATVEPKPARDAKGHFAKKQAAETPPEHMMS